MENVFLLLIVKNMVITFVYNVKIIILYLLIRKNVLKKKNYKVN